MKKRIRELYEEIMEDFIQTSDVCFQEYASFIMAKDLKELSMVDIIELYGALSNSCDGDIVIRMNSDDNIHEIFGTETVGLTFRNNDISCNDDCPF